MRNALLMTCLFISAMLAGCNGSRVEYYSDHPLIGVRVTFKLPVAYVTNLPDEYGDPETVRISRNIELLEQAERDKRYATVMDKVSVTPVMANESFVVIAAYRVVQHGIKQAFSPDYDVVVLRDNWGKIATMLLRGFEQYTETWPKSPVGEIRNESGKN